MLCLEGVPNLPGAPQDPLGLALGSPIFPSGCEGKLEAADIFQVGSAAVADQVDPNQGFREECDPVFGRHGPVAPAGPGIREGVGGGNVRFDVQHGGAVEQVGRAQQQTVGGEAAQFHGAQPDGVGAVRGTGGEDAVTFAVGGKGRTLLLS